MLLSLLLEGSDSTKLFDLNHHDLSQEAWST